MIKENNKIESYSQRVVAFMDILGFKDLVTNVNENNKLFKLMNYLKWLNKSNYEGFLKECDIGKEVTVFSDSIVISYDINDVKGSVFYILLDIIHIQLDLASLGILVRGGVSIGSLYHKEEVIFGPAMIKAYDLESKYANYPRIIVDEELLKYAYQNPSPQHTGEIELDYMMSVLDKDEDDYFYTDFLSQSEELDNPEDITLIINKLNNLISKGLKNEIESVRKKYEWLEYYINKQKNKDK